MRTSLLSMLLLCIGFAQPSLSAQVIFTNGASYYGIMHSSGTTRPGGGVSFCDFDGDGWDDITLATGPDQPLQFYQNIQGQLVKKTPFVDDLAEVNHILWVDFDNDGDKDLYYTAYDAINRLYRNNGDMSFTDITASAGLPTNEHRSYGASWGDYNRDGWLDLYFGERMVPAGSYPNQNRLFKNNADGTFTEVTFQAGVVDLGKIPFCTGFLDINEDRWPDLYVINDKATGNAMFQNNANGTFTNVSVVSQANIAIDAMSIAMGDYDKDGREDVYVTNTEEGCHLLRNEGPAGMNGQYQFSNVAPESGVGFYGVGWGANWLDADNDGDLDLYVSGALVGSDVISSAFYTNEGDASFSQPNAGFVGDTVTSFSNAIGDINRDGYPDIMVVNQDPWLSQLWQNSGDNNLHWIKLKLQGVLSNRDGVGSKIEVFSGDDYQMRYTHCGSGFLGQNSDQHHFGLRQNEVIDSILITWPTGHMDRLQNISSQQLLTVIEGSTTNGDIAVDEDISLVLVSNTHPTIAMPWKISPNPATQVLRIHGDALSSTPLYYAIVDVHGHRVSGNHLLTGGVIQVSNLSDGLYILVLWDDSGEKWVHKWIKQ